MYFEIVEGEDYKRTLDELQLEPYEIEALREALDWKLSREPESGIKVNTNVITLFYGFYLLRSDCRLLIVYRIQGERVVLEEIHRDIPEDF